MNYSIKVRTVLQFEKKKWLFLVCFVVLTHLFCQSLMLPYGKALLSMLPDAKDNENIKDGETSIMNNKFVMARGVRSTNSHDDLEGLMEKDKNKNLDFDSDGDGLDNDFQFVENETLDYVDVDLKDGVIMQNGKSQESDSLLQIGANEFAKGSSENRVKDGDVIKERSESDVITSTGSKIKEVSDGVNFAAKKNGSSSITNKPVKKKMRSEMPPKTVLPINEMQQLLVRNRARSRAMRPRWSSERDKEIIAAKLKIESTPVLKSDQDLYAPLFRNVSMFKRSYELMERTLKIYVYKEGKKPIFHNPILKGLYASEGWFMKLMESNKQFVVKDPKKAHLFYMPFSARMLEYTLYVRNSHNRTNLRQYLKDYSENIAAKYRFWNRTGGADHFLVACQDWAPYETRHHMEHCIKAFCNADVTTGFKIGRDVSFPETYVRSARNPLRDLGGKPPSQRHILSFYAGNLHGYLRPILLKHWQDRDPDMKILGPMPPGISSKMTYIEHMKSSKFCICPKGYEVNSPRIIEAIFYECVPVIISDNFVPPFFEVLNWEAFSLILAEKVIPNLRNILDSVSEEKYRDLQLGVRKVQWHFLWHLKPVKYDLFHMTLHSIWYNRVFQMKVR